MTKPTLVARRDAPEAIAAVFCNSSRPEDSQFRLEVQDDKCFPNDDWLTIGCITVHPESAAGRAAVNHVTLVARALRHGFFEWKLPTKEKIVDDTMAFFEASKSSAKMDKDKDKDRVNQAIKEVAHIAIRCGMAYPVLDPLAIRSMPYIRPVSVVVDTSAIIQGGLDFVARHLAPQVRIKVPAIVHMEILNFVDRYFTQRRDGRATPKMLLDHVKGQGAHRALLRLALDPKIEIERPRLGPDPLRGIVQPDSDGEDKNLNLSRIQRSFADRLILETAIQHRNTVNPDHDVKLLTSDQGLARMALVEGIEPLFCDANATDEIFDSTLTGVLFVPFISDAARFSCCSLADIIWEAATSFGSARLVDNQTGVTYTVSALQSTVPWQLHHTLEDLLWAEVGSRAAPATPHTSHPDPKPESPTHSTKAGASQSGSSRRPSPARPASSTRSRQGAYGFQISSMLDLLEALNSRESMSHAEAMSCINVKSKSTYGEYNNFLAAGGLVTKDRDQLHKTPAMGDLVSSMHTPDHEGMSKAFQRVPSFASFALKLKLSVPLTQDDSGLRKDAFRTYAGLAELACIGMRVHEQGSYALYATPTNPTPNQFVGFAIGAFDAIRKGERFALAGEWLERLATANGIHPVHAKQRLAEAHQAGYMRRFFEGSTPETRFPTKSIHCLETRQGKLAVRIINLYYGDFLLPGRASVSIRLLSIGADE